MQTSHGKRYIVVCESDCSDYSRILYKILEVVNVTSLKIGDVLSKGSLNAYESQGIDIMIMGKERYE